MATLEHCPGVAMASVDFYVDVNIVFSLFFYDLVVGDIFSSTL